ncbi:MAG: lysophospholipid acyltransferase family protein [Desulfobacteraceae bacterium]
MLRKKETGATGLKWWLIGWAGKLLIDFLFLFSRVHIIGYEDVADRIRSRRFIFAFWHSRILLLCHRYKKLNASIMVSNSGDGEIIAQVLQRHGHKTVRGSTGKRGMRALIQQIEDMRTHTRPGVVIPDGPQGPRHKVQRGVILLAQKTGVPIIPLTYSSKRRKVFNSWDRFLLPYPGSSGVLVYGRPIEVQPAADERAIQMAMGQLEVELNRITREADHYFNHEFIS